MTPLRFVFGEDLFLSYSRSDSTAYAAALASELSSRGFSCFLDQWDTAPGQEIPPRVLRSLDRGSMLVLVGSPGAARSAAVEREVRRFLETGRPIVPISVGGALEASDWFPVVAGASLSVETPEALADGEPSPGVLNRIESSFRFTRRNQRVRRTFLAAALGLLALIGVAGWAARNARLATRAAEVSEARAEEQQVRTEEATERATEEQERAEAASAEAERQEEIAAEQSAIAVERTEEARSQEEIAGERLRRARSAEIAASSQAQLAAEPDLAALLAVASLEAADTFEARRALLAAITERPGLESVLRGPEQGRRSASGRVGSARITDLWISSDGTRLGAKDEGHRVTVWSLTERPFLAQPLRAAEGLHDVRIDADFRRLVGIHQGDGKVRVRSIAEEEPEIVVEMPADLRVADVALSPNGLWIALSTFDAAVILLDAESGRLLAVPQPGSRPSPFGRLKATPSVKFITSLWFTPDSKILRWTIDDTFDKEYDYAVDVPDAAPIDPLPDYLKRMVAASAHGPTLVVEPLGEGLARVRLDAGVPSVESLGFQAEAGSVTAISADGSMIAVGDNDGTLRLFDENRRGRSSLIRQGHSADVSALALSPDGDLLVSGSDDGAVMLWRTRGELLGTRTTLTANATPGDGVRAARFAQKGEIILVATDGGILSIDPTTSEETTLIRCGGFGSRALAVASDDRIAYSSYDWSVGSGSRRVVHVLDLVEQRCSVMQFLMPDDGPWDLSISAIAFSHNGELLAAAAPRGDLILWDLESGRELGQYIHRPEDARGFTNSLVWLPDDYGLFLGHSSLQRYWYDDALNRYSLQVPQIQIEEGMARSEAVAVSRDGRWLAGSSADEVVLWDGLSGRIAARFSLQKSPPDIGDDTVTALSLNGRSQMLAVGERTGKLSLFDLATRQWLGSIPLPLGLWSRVHELDFSPDGSRLAGVVDGELVIWPLTPESWARRACEIANRRLTELERTRFLGPGTPGPGPCREARAGD